MTDNLYCNERKDGHRLHELVEKVNWNLGKIEYYCMWCNKVFNS